MNTPTEITWQDYCTTELAAVTPLLTQHGFTLEAEQPHLQGERFLMQAVTTTSGRKLILFGRTSTGERVVIKATRDHGGKAELAHERRCRAVLNQMQFAAAVFVTPPEIACIEAGGFVIVVTAYIEQPSTFLERPLAEQFEFALNAFKAQEGTHATTYRHQQLIKSVYQVRTAREYLAQFKTFQTGLTTSQPDSPIPERLERVSTLLQENQTILDQYAGFLTHTDFVPHNIRIDSAGTMYLLDHSSLVFGNKYEGWARFINFMELYNPPLATHLVQYVNDNRVTEEQLSLKLMRLYRLSELMWYYAAKLPYCTGDLYTLNHTRVHFWSDVLEHVQRDQPVPTDLIETYQATRDRLRTPAEKNRQKGLH